MKLAFCLFKYFPYGGLQRDFLRIAREAKANGHEIHAYTMSWEGDLAPEITLHLIPIKAKQNHTKASEFIKTVNRIFQTEKFDLIVGFNKMPGLDIYYAADVCWKYRLNTRRKFYRLLPRYRQLLAFEKATFDIASKTQILMLSDKTQKEYESCYSTQKNRFHLLPPGIDQARFQVDYPELIRQKIRASFHLNSDAIMLLMVGSGFKTKGLDRILQGLASLNAAMKARCHLFILGQDKIDLYQKLAQKLNLNLKQIHFLGGRDDAPHFMHAADFLLHPAYHENTGTVLLEALVCGLPVLTTDICGYAHFIQDANAGIVLSSPFIQEQFNHALLEMISSSKKSFWRENALCFTKTARIYHLPQKAVQIIESVAQDKIKNSSFSFEEMMALKGEIFRKQNGRLTQRIDLSGQTVFIKQHSGIGYKEIFKNLLQLRFPILGAKNEWLALQQLSSLGIHTPKAYAYDQKGFNPAHQQSYVVMSEITNTISLEELTQKNTIEPTLKRSLLKEIARIARIMHENGINHRDFYLCHFLLDKTYFQDANQFKLYLIDLHRAQIRQQTPNRWKIKDLAGLYFSSKGIKLSRFDLLRFIKHYRQNPLRDTMKTEKHFWEKVIQQGEKLYREHA